MEREKIVDMIKKLIRLQESPNENEAALAAAKASELLVKYNLTMADVADDGSPVRMVELRSEFRNTVLRPWMTVLAVKIAQHTFTKVYYSKIYESRKEGSARTTGYFHYTFYGRQSNAEVASYLYDQLAYKLRELSFVAEKIEKGIHPWANGNDLKQYRASYMYGASVAVSVKLEEIRSRFTPAEKAIVLVRDAEVEKAWEARSAEFRHRKATRATIRQDAYNRGYEDGKSIDIHDGLRGSDKRALKGS